MEDHTTFEERVLRVPNVNGFLNEALEYMDTFFWEIDIEGYAYLDDDWRHDFICIRDTTMPHYRELTALETQCSRLEIINKENYIPYFRDDGLDYFNILPACDDQQRAIYRKARELRALIKEEMRRQ